MKKITRATWITVMGLLFTCATAQAQTDIENIEPSSAEAGSDVDITIYGGVDCNFSVFSLELSFDPAIDITHDELTAEQYNVLYTQIHIPRDTTPGPQTVTATSNGMQCVGVGVFEVTCTDCASASITSINPASGNRGTTVDINITGNGTHFDSSSTVEFDGGGIQILGLTAISETSLDASISISSDAALGSRKITVTTGSETAQADGLFLVEQQAIDVSPSEGVQGQIIPTVTINGGDGNYSATSEVDLGEGIQIQSFSSPADDTLVLNNVSIADDAFIGDRTLIITIEGHRSTYTGAFTVLQGINTVLVSVSPNHGDRGHPGLDIDLVGQNTHFDNPDVRITLSGTSVTASPGQTFDSTHLAAIMFIENSATEDVRTISVKVGCDTSPCEEVSLEQGFTITEPSTLDSAQPSHIEAGQTIEVMFSATDGQFVQDETWLAFEPPDGIDVESVSETDANHLSATLIISDTAKGVPRDVKAVTGTEIAIGEQLVDIQNPSIDSIIPGSTFQGMTGLKVTISGTDIPFAEDTSIEFSGDGISLSGISYDSEKPDRIVVSIDVAPTAKIGHRDVTVITNEGITTTAKGVFSILSRVSAEQNGGCNCSATQDRSNWSLMLLALLGLWLSFSRRK